MDKTKVTLICDECGNIHKQSDRRIVVNHLKQRKERGVHYSKESQCANIDCESIDYTVISK